MKCLPYCIRDKVWCKFKKPMKKVGESLSDIIVEFVLGSP